jgi:hypothetical protein
LKSEKREQLLNEVASEMKMQKENLKPYEAPQEKNIKLRGVHTCVDGHGDEHYIAYYKLERNP